MTTVLTLRMRSFSACIKFHDRENMPDTDGICVANHTSPIGTSAFVTLFLFRFTAYPNQFAVFTHKDHFDKMFAKIICENKIIAQQRLRNATCSP